MERKKEYIGELHWQESEDFIWAIEEYIGSCGYDGETILWLREHDLSVGDFEEDISVEEIAERLIDGIEYSATEIDYIIKWLYEYMTANDMSLCELDDMCWEDSNSIFNMIFK